jgi:hypothetical protein
MGRHRSSVQKPSGELGRQHPIWRGIGCLLMVLVPVISYAAADVSMEYYLCPRNLVPRDLIFTIQAPELIARFLPGLAYGFNKFLGNPYLPATLLLTLFFILVLGGFFSFFYAVMYRMSAPTRYGPMDAPPPRVKIKKYKR